MNFKIGKPTITLPPRQGSMESRYTPLFNRVDAAKGKYIPLIFKTSKEVYAATIVIRRACAFRKKKYEFSIRQNSLYVRTK